MSPVISRKLVRARKPYCCEAFICEREQSDIEPGEQYVRLYGNADDPDPKYVIRVHPECENDATRRAEPR